MGIWRTNNDGFLFLIGGFPTVWTGEAAVVVQRSKRRLGRSEGEMTLRRRPVRDAGSFRRRRLMEFRSSGGGGHGAETEMIATPATTN